MSFFKPNYPKTLIFLAGVLIGLSASFEHIYAKIGLFSIAVGMVYFSEIIRKKEEE